MEKLDSQNCKVGVECFSRNDAIQLLKQFAESEFEIVRLRSIQTLRDINATACISTFIFALKDSDEDVRIDAAEALGQLRDQSAIEHLLESLVHDPCSEVKLTCVNSLALLNAKVAIPIFRSLVVNRSPEIIWDSEESYQDEWDNWLDIQIATIKALGLMKDEKAIELISEAIKDPEGQDLDSIAFDALASIGEKSLPTLAEFANSPLRRRKYYALRAVSKLKLPASLDILWTALNDGDDSIRVLAFQTLLDVNSSPELIERGLTDNSDDVRQICYSQVDINQGEIIERILKDPSSKVQLEFIDKLKLSREITDKNDLEFKILKLFVKSDSVEVSATALAKLSAFAPTLVKKQIDKLIFSAESDSEILERQLWAIISEIRQSNHHLCLNWLLSLCESSITSVRLKALAELGKLLHTSNLSVKFFKKSMELIFNLARYKNFEENDTGDQVKNEDNSVKDIKSIGLKVDDTVSIDSGPTSSISAILNQNRVSNHEFLNTELGPCTNRTEIENFSNQFESDHNFEVDSNKLSTTANCRELETRKLAIQLLGENKDSQEILMEIVEEGKLEIAEMVLSSLHENILNFGISISADRISQILQYYIAIGNRDIQAQVLKILSVLSELDQNLKEFLQSSLSNSDPTIKVVALKTNCEFGFNLDSLQSYLQDPSLLVRQECMRLMFHYLPDKVNENIIDFLLENPDQNIDIYMREFELEREILGGHVALRLSNPKFKAKQPVLLNILGSLYQNKVA